MFKGSLKCVSRIFEGSYMGVSKKIEWCSQSPRRFKGGSKGFKRSSKGVLREFQGRFKDVLRKYQGRLKKVSTVFQ